MFILCYDYEFNHSKVCYEYLKKILDKKFQVHKCPAEMIM